MACVVEKAVAGFDPHSGSVLWSHPHENRGGDITSTLIWGPDNLLFFSGAYQGGSRTLRLSFQDGQTDVILHLASLSPDGLKEKSRVQVLENLAWTPPSIGGTRLYLRDRKSIVVLELK